MKKYYVIFSVICLAVIAFYVFHLSAYFTIESLKTYHNGFKELVTIHPFLSAITYVFAYVLVVTLSVPVAIFMTLLGGYLFPMPFSVIYVLIGATVGSTFVFLLARSFLRVFFRKKIGTFLEKMQSGFQKNEVSYLLFLRFIPLFPFWAVNVASAFFNVSLKTFLWTTILGVIPGTIAYTLAGSGLQEIFDEKGSSLSSVFNIRLNIALGLLAIMALLPVFFKKIKNRYFMSITYRDLYKKVDEIKAVVEVGSYYTHYKNLFKKYKILHIGLLEGSDVPCVIYQAVEDPGSKEGLVWVRLLDNFLSSVIVDGKEVSRFIKCNDNI